MKPFHSVTVIGRAHDVRHLVGCYYCKGLADDRHTVPLNGAHAHGRCYIATHGVAQLLRLPREVLGQLTLNDIGAKAMRRVLENEERT